MQSLPLKIRDPRSAGRRGITLIELLVVMTIVSIITAASIPLLTTGVDNRRVREAARLVASYIGAAKSRAIETGRPAGVMIQRFPSGGTLSNYALTLVTVEVPAPYAGDYANSMAFITVTGSTATLAGLGTNTSGGGGGTTPSTQDLGWRSLVRVGDLIQFGYSGRTYMLLGNSTAPTTVGGVPSFTSSTSTQSIAGQLLSSTGFTGQSTGTACNLWATDGSLAIPAATNPVTMYTGTPPTATTTTIGIPYQIFRQPTKSAVQPLQLPEGTVIDLMESGVGLTGTHATFLNQAPYQNPIITFGPTGTVGTAYYDSYAPQHLQSALYLLIGKREGMEDLGLATTANNINHHHSMWVAVGPQSGLVVTAENMTGALQNARQYAQAASSMGGR